VEIKPRGAMSSKALLLIPNTYIYKMLAPRSFEMLVAPDIIEVFLALPSSENFVATSSYIYAATPQR
jgi:hypothetical protein